MSPISFHHYAAPSICGCPPSSSPNCCSSGHCKKIRCSHSLLSCEDTTPAMATADRENAIPLLWERPALGQEEIRIHPIWWHWVPSAAFSRFLKHTSTFSCAMDWNHSYKINHFSKRAGPSSYMITHGVVMLRVDPKQVWTVCGRTSHRRKPVSWKSSFRIKKSRVGVHPTQKHTRTWHLKCINNVKQ